MNTDPDDVDPREPVDQHPDTVGGAFRLAIRRDPSLTAHDDDEEQS